MIDDDEHLVDPGLHVMAVSLYRADRERLERLVKRDRLAGVLNVNMSSVIRRALEIYEREDVAAMTVRHPDPPEGKGQCAICGAIVRLDQRWKATPVIREHSEGYAGLSYARRAQRCAGSGLVPAGVTNPHPVETAP